MSNKIYQPLKLISNQDDEFGFETLIVEMSEVTIEEVGSGFISSFNRSKSEIFIFVLNSAIAQGIIANSENELEINLGCFDLLPAKFKNFKNQEAYFHYKCFIEKDRQSKSETEVTSMIYVMECKICYMLTGFNIPILKDTREIFDRDFFFHNILSNRNIECKWCENKGFAIDELRFEVYETKGLTVDITPSEKMLRRAVWRDTLDETIEGVLHEVLPAAPTDWGWARRCAFCELVFKGKWELSTAGFKRGLYLLDRVIMENGRIQKVDVPLPFLFDVSISEDLPLEFKLAADKCAIETVKVPIFRDPEFAYLINIKK